MRLAVVIALALVGSARADDLEDQLEQELLDPGPPPVPNQFPNEPCTIPDARSAASVSTSVLGIPVRLAAIDLGVLRSAHAGPLTPATTGDLGWTVYWSGCGGDPELWGVGLIWEGTATLQCDLSGGGQCCPDREQDHAAVLHLPGTGRVVATSGDAVRGSVKGKATVDVCAAFDTWPHAVSRVEGAAELH